MKIAIGSDHGAFRMKQRIASHLVSLGHEVTDLGTEDEETSVDYPRYAARVAEAVSSGRADKGVLMCGTGIGMSIAANKHEGIRAALVHDPFTARLSRQHNDANVLVMGGRLLAEEYGCHLVDIWLSTPFEGDRHQRRIDLITTMERG